MAQPLFQPEHRERGHLEAVPAVRAPGFFIVGAPKCGTTALYAWLKQHPDVFLPEGKEPHFFGKDLTWRHRDTLTPEAALERYLELFRDAGPARAVGEASTMYLYSREAADEIFQFNPEARIVVMLRNPVDQMYSFHSERLYGQNEDIVDFVEALKAEDERKHGERIPALARLVEGCFYRDVARYSNQVERYLDVFGADRVHVIVHDDMRKDPEGVFRGVARFLEIDESFVPEFVEVNGNKVPRFPALQRLLRNRNSGWRTALRRALPPGLRKRIFRSVGRANTLDVTRRKMDPALRGELQHEFEFDVRRLSALIGRDLSHWVRPA